jgi:hypothetical protein
VAAKVWPIGPHQIRHLIASTLLDAGYGVHEVAERLGQDPATLMRYYTRVNAARRLQATDRIAELMTAPEIQPRPGRNRPDFTTSLLPEAGTFAEMRTDWGPERVCPAASDRSRGKKTDSKTCLPAGAGGGPASARLSVDEIE